MYRAIIVDDDQWALKDIERAFPFERCGFTLSAACKSAEEAGECFARLLPDLLITDIQMKNKSGLDLLRECKKLREDVVAVILSGHDSFDYARQALNAGAYYYMLKPIDDAEAAALLKKIYLTLSLNGRAAEGESNPFTQILEYVNDHLSPEFSLDDLSARFSYNKTYLSEMFHDRIGISFSQYKKKLYLQRAKDVLSRPGAQVRDAAEAAGFQEMRYFSRVFKEMTGMTPREYQRTTRKDHSGEA